MASLTGQTVSSTYDGLLKTDDNDILGAAPKEITDGLGNGSGMTLSTTGDVSIAGDLTVDGAILDSNGVPGASGQILSSTVTGTDWVSLSEISGVDGTGTANYIAKWTDGDTIGNSVIYDNGNVGINESTPLGKLHITKGVGSGASSVNANADELVLESDGLAGLTILTPNTGQGRIHFGDPESQTIGKILYSHTDDSMTFQTNSSDAMTIDSAGNVGIGTSSPAYKLDVKSDDVLGGIYIQGDNAPALRLRDTSDNGDSLIFTNNGGRLILSADDSNATAGSSLEFKVDGTERMRIDSAGNVGIGTSSPSVKLHISENTSTYIQVQNTTPSFEGSLILGAETSENTIFSRGLGTANKDLRFIIGATERMRLQSNGDLHVDGDVIAYSTTISDQRLKDDVQTIDNALDKVSNLRGVSYTWNNGNRKGQKDLGLIAQEVEQVLPELVREKEMPMIDGGTYKTVDYEKIVGVLIEAVKELKAEIEILKSK